MPNQATYDDANLLLRLFELRREPELRKARDWFGPNFNATSREEMMKMAPPGSQENKYVRMVLGYWEMAASLVTAGVLNQDLFFQSSGELLFVWEKARHVVPTWREFTKNPNSWKNLETVGNAYIKHMEANGPEAYPAFQSMVKMTAGGESAARA
jgi:hypothetical protein